MPRSLDQPKQYAADGTARRDTYRSVRAFAAQQGGMRYEQPYLLNRTPAKLRENGRVPFGGGTGALFLTEDPTEALRPSYPRLTDDERRRAEQLPVQQAA